MAKTISNKCLYALKAVLELSALEPNKTISISAIATKRDIPVRFLESILRELKEAGIAHSERGKDGGYRLRRLPATIKVGDIVRIFHTATSSLTGSCCFSDLDKSAELAWLNVFDSKNFLELAQQELRSKLVPDYSI